MTIEAEVLQALKDNPASGGSLIERFQAEGAAFLEGRGVLVYAALANLRARGEAEPLAVGEGEAIWGSPGSPAPPPKKAGAPPSFKLGPKELAVIDRELARMTARLPRHYFEELRRVVVADADRRAFHGARAADAVRGALRDLGPRAAIGKVLRRAEGGGPVPLRLFSLPLRWVVAPLAVLLLLVLLRSFVVGVFTVPPNSISMAPTLIPSEEGGDALVVVNLLAYRFGEPGRGDVVVFDWPDGKTLVKRVMGMPGETIEIRNGDLFVGGERLVKERWLLDRVKVPLALQEDFENASPGLFASAHGGYRLPDGSIEGARRAAGPDVIVTAVATLEGAAGSVTLTIDEGNGAVHTLAMNERGGAVAVSGREPAGGLDYHALRLRPDLPRRIWVTNADRVFRIALDGREVYRSPPLRREGGRTSVTAVVDGDVVLEGLELARDLVYGGSGRWTVGRGEVFVLGDNSADSRDSRTLGGIGKALLLGRVWAVAWPPSRIRVVD